MSGSHDRDVCREPQTDDGRHADNSHWREFAGSGPREDNIKDSTLKKPERSEQLPRHIAILGIISFLTAMSSAMVYGLLPLFLVRVLHTTIASVGFIEGIAEATTSVTKIVSGIASDWLGRRKPIVLLGYALSAINKLLFPLAGDASSVLLARVIDRVGKGTRDAPRDAFLTDVTPMPIRGSGFGLRLAFYTSGFVAGPLTAMLLMRLSDDNFRFVFWVAVIPAALAIVVLLVALKEPPRRAALLLPRLRVQRRDLTLFPVVFWWAIAIASLLSMARFSHAFLVLKAHEMGIDDAFVPVTLVLMYVVYACAAYPFGVLADRFERRIQLGLGAVLLIIANVVLAGASVAWVLACGVTLWGMQMAVMQGLLSAVVADAAPEQLRGTAFGMFELAVGVATFAAGAGALWMLGGSTLTFVTSAAVAAVVVLLLLLRPMAGAFELAA
jgi:MFS family permease